MAEPTPGYVQVQSNSEDDENKTLRLVVVGMTAAGKSALGNAILGADKHIPAPFVSKASPVPVTTESKIQFANVFGYRISIVDTPGLFSSTNYQDHVNETDILKKSISLLEPGPHTILLVVKVCRFTEEVVQGCYRMRETFGENIYKFVIVVFTNVDSLYDDDDDDDESEDDEKRRSIAVRKALKLRQFVDGIPDGPCRELLNSCDMRFVGINSKFKLTSDDNRQQIQQLLSTVDKLKKENTEKCYTRDLLEKDIKDKLKETSLRWYQRPRFRIGFGVASFLAGITVIALLVWYFKKPS